MTFTEDLHPRGQAQNAGQFRAKENDAPTSDLSTQTEAFSGSAAVSEMRRAAPDGARKVIFELYSEGDTDAELFAFQGFTGEDGIELDTDADLHEFYFDLGSRFDAGTAEDAGFERDGPMFVLEVPPTDPAATEQELNDAVLLHQLAAFGGGHSRRADTDRAVHEAAVNHIRALSSQLTHPVDVVVLDQGNGLGLHVVRTERADGTHVHDHTNDGRPEFTRDRELLAQMSFAASNIRDSALTPLEQQRPGAPHRLRLNP